MDWEEDATSGRPVRFQQTNNNWSESLSEGHANGDSLIHIKPGDRLDDTLRLVNAELSVLGLPTIFRVDERGKPVLSIDLLANTCYEMIMWYQRSMRMREDLETNQRRTVGDLEHSQRMHRRTEDSLQESVRSLAKADERERKLTNEIKTLNGTVKSLKDELRRFKLEVQHRDAQFNHERKKWERESAGLRDRLHTVIGTAIGGPSSLTSSSGVGSGGSSSSGPRVPSMDMLNCLSKLEGRRQTWARPRGASSTVTPSVCGVGTGSNPQADLQVTMVRQLESKQTELLHENRELRELLWWLRTEMDSTLANRDVDPSLLPTPDDEEVEMGFGEGCGDWGSPAQLDAEGFVHMPYQMVKSDVERGLRQRWRLLRTKWRSAGAEVGTPSTESHSLNSTFVIGREPGPRGYPDESIDADVEVDGDVTTTNATILRPGGVPSTGNGDVQDKLTLAQVSADVELLRRQMADYEALIKSAPPDPPHRAGTNLTPTGRHATTAGVVAGPSVGDMPPRVHLRSHPQERHGFLHELIRSVDQRDEDETNQSQQTNRAGTGRPSIGASSTFARRHSIATSSPPLSSSRLIFTPSPMLHDVVNQLHSAHQ